MLSLLEGRFEPLTSRIGFLNEPLGRAADHLVSADGGVLGEAGGEVEADRLPSQSAALLAEQKQPSLGVEVLQAQGECATSPTRGFGMRAQ